MVRALVSAARSTSPLQRRDADALVRRVVGDAADGDPVLELRALQRCLLVGRQVEDSGAEISLDRTVTASVECN